MAKSRVQVSARFAKTFALVCEHYRCPPDEIEIMKQLARENMQDAETCFEAMRREIEGAACGINERIKENA